MNESTDFFGHAFQKKDSGTSLIHSNGIFDDGFRTVCGSALGLETTHGSRTLGCQPDMSENDHTCLCDSLDLIGNSYAAFQLDSIHIGFLIKTHSIAYGVFHTGMICAKGHIADQIGIGSTSAHTLTMGNADIHRYGYRTAHAIYDHPYRVTAEDHIHTRFLRIGCIAGIIQYDPYCLFTFFLHLIKVKNGFFLRHRHPPSTHKGHLSLYIYYSTLSYIRKVLFTIYTKKICFFSVRIRLFSWQDVPDINSSPRVILSLQHQATQIFKTRK